MSGLGYRLYKMSLFPGLLLSLPLLLTAAWYAWSAHAQIDRYRRAGEGAPPVDAELFQIALHDELYRDLRRLTLPERPATSRLPLFSLSVTRHSLDALNQQLYTDSSTRSYVKGYVQKAGLIQEVGIRHRGGQPWQWLGAQKSLKFRMGRDELLDGTRVFNLLNDPTPFGMEDQIILDLARELGLLAPEYYPARVRLNNSDMGVYRFAAQPTEGLLRRGRRVPGSMYSGDTEAVDPALKVGALFSSRGGWQQVAAQSPGTPEDWSALERLLGAIQGASFLDFAAYAQQEIALDRYALFDALDVVFGGDDHDYFSNHKFYFDRYTGRLEPVVWSFRGFQHEPAFNLVDHPLLVRLKLVPGYLTLRNRAVFELLTGKASVPEVRGRADRMFEALLPELAADPYWDAYKLLPRVTRFHRFMLRPMSRGRWLLAAKAELEGFGRRNRFLLDALERPGTTLGWIPGGPAPGRLEMTVGGDGAYRLREIAVAGPCEGAFTLHADVDRDHRRSAADRLVAAGVMGSSSAVTAYADLLPGVVLVARPNGDEKRGRVRVQAEARRYPYLLSTPDCPPSETALIIDNVVTGDSSRLIAAAAAEPAPYPSLPPTSDVPRLAVSQRSPHPWDFGAPPAPEAVRLGPGTLRLLRTRVFASHQTVSIAANTRLELGADASLVFFGPVRALGTLAKPIVITRADSSRPFGGVALQGSSTAGSRLEHVILDGAGRVRHGAVDYTAALNIHDTADVTVKALSVVHSSGSGDVVHAPYVQNLRLHEASVREAPVDAVDLEFTTAEVRGLKVAGAGDDCLDLMGTTLRLSDSALLGCTNNAVSAGEETELNAYGVLIADSKLGVLAKNSSQVRVTRSLIYRSGTALRTHRPELYFAGASAIGANDLFAVDCGKLSDAALGTSIDTGQVKAVLPDDDGLDELRAALGLRSWQALDPFVASLRAGGNP